MTPKVPFPGLGHRLAVALEANGINTVAKLQRAVAAGNLLSLPGINTQAQAETIETWLKLNNR